MHGLKKWFLVVLAVAVFFVGCGTSPESFVNQQFPLVDVQGSGSSLQKIYQAKDESVPDVAQEIADENEPEQMSAKSDERMFLVYPDSVIHVQQDPENKQDTLVEVDTIQFVREHYDPGFLQPFLQGVILGHIFGSHWQSSPNYGSGYHGYGSYRSGGSKYKAPATPPSGSFTTPPKSSGGKGTVIPRSNGGSTTTPPSSGGGYRAPPKSSSGGGMTTKPKSSGGSFFSPPKSSGGRGGVVRRR